MDKEYKQTPREIVKKAIAFAGPERLPMSLPAPYPDDFSGMAMNPSPDWRPWGDDYGPGKKRSDEWGAVWENIGVCKLGEVKEYPLTTWDDYAKMNIPDIREPRRWTELQGQKSRAGDKYIISYGISLYERIHFLRGLENVWMDIYEEPDKLKNLIGLLVDMNLYAIEKYAEAGADGYMFCDDWGLQDRLMISPEKWREFWKPAYAKIYKAAHQAGMQTFLHSCGYIVDILDDLIECGLDVVHMDQQMNMGLKVLHERFAGRLTFWSPVDIQTVMCDGSEEEIRAYCHELVNSLGTPKGGIMVRWYTDPAGAGHSQKAIDAMCSEFVKISEQRQ